MMTIIAKTKDRCDLKLTGKTNHYKEGVKIQGIESLQIVKLEGDGVYLLYYDAQGVELTDTWHKDVDSALDQANFEFGIELDKWIFTSN